MRRRLLPLAALPLLVAACTDQSVGPTNPLESAPTIQMSHVGGDPVDDLCNGLSPCDAFDYDRDGDGSPDGLTGAPGFCFLPPTVDNHLSDPACSGDFVRGLDGVFELVACQVDYDGRDGSEAPDLIPESCEPGKPLMEDPDGGEFYETSVQWKRNGPNKAEVGDVFRLYVVRGDVHYAHRDVVIDPNLTTPADGYVHAIGYGNEPIKVRIADEFSCVFFDTQGDTPDNAATCLVAGEVSYTFETNQLTTTFDFFGGNDPFLATFEVSECLSLGFFDLTGMGRITGNALVDVPLADCQISLSSDEIDSLIEPGRITVRVEDDRWDDVTGVFKNARLNVLQVDDEGIAALPPFEDPGWFGEATSSNPILRWIDRSLDLLASALLPQPLYAEGQEFGWDFTRMSDFQVALLPIMEHIEDACDSSLASCDLGMFDAGDEEQVSVLVTAPDRAGVPFTVPDTRLHFFPSTGSTVACPDPAVAGQQCYEPTEPPTRTDLSTAPPLASTWDHLVVITSLDGLGTVDWTLGEGDNTLEVSACGVARPGGNEPDSPSGGVWGDLIPGGCSDRFAALTQAGAFDNGPADGHTPFEPVDTQNEVAIYGLPLTFGASTCPQINVDGYKGDAGVGPSPGDEWETCADKTGFIAPLKGPKATEHNAWLYTWNDGSALYVGLEVATNDLGDKIFINLAEQFEGSDFMGTAGDDLLVIDFQNGSTENDWYFTLACEGNNSASLCGDPDTVTPDGVDLDLVAAGETDGAGAGTVFYEFKRPFGATLSPKEDLGATPGQDIGLRLTVTQGQGGGKGGFVYPDPQTSPVQYHVITLQ